MYKILLRSLAACLLTFAFHASAVTLGEIRSQIDSILARSTVINNSWSILIQNQSGTFTYYDRNPNTGLKPASNTKLYTTAAAFARLGTGHRFHTEVYVNGTISAGTLTGDLILIGDHDFTWSTRYYPTARTPLDQIAQQCYDLGLRKVSGNIIGRGECVYNETISNANGAAAFKNALSAKGINVNKAKTSGQTGFTPTGSLYTSWDSMTLELACKPLNKSSVNVFADTLLKHIGWEISGANTYTAGASVVTSWLQSIGINTAGIVMQDGSGLSHNNRFTATQTLQLVRHMYANFPTFDDTLPIGCVDGTISGRFCGTPGAGNVHAKTGTLTGVVTLSGYIYNQTDNQIYLFSMLGNNVSDDPATKDAIDDAVVVMAQTAIPNDGGGSGSQIIIDNGDAGFSLTGSWSTGTTAPDRYGVDYRFHGTGTSADEATWTYLADAAGNYEVFAWWSQGSNRSAAAPYIVSHSGGSTTVVKNQQMNGGSWQSLGTYSLNAGANQVRLGTVATAGFVVIADAVKIEVR